MSAGLYILRDREPVAVTVAGEWATWFERADRTVAKTSVGDVDVSTVFLGIDHRFVNTGPPLVFETMVFGGALDEEQLRWSTWAEAEVGHAEVVARVVAAGKVGP